MTREWIDLCRNWTLSLEDQQTMIFPDFRPDQPLSVDLPHTWNATDSFTPSRGYWRGVGWYRKILSTQKEWADRRVLLELAGFFCTAQVWLNQKCIRYDEDGFTGQFYDLTRFLNPAGQENTLAIRIDSRHDPELLPGREVPDYLLYGGIYREVRLHLTSYAHIVERGIAFTTPEVSPEHALCHIATEITGLALDTLPVHQVHSLLLDPDGNPAGEASTEFYTSGTVHQDIDIRNPRLWSVDEPQLYTLISELQAQTPQGWAVIDRVETPVGIRFFEFQVNGDFLLNGRKVLLKGVNRHQDIGGLGNAMPKRFQVLDAEIIKDLGGNFVRLSHYPQHPDFLDACDRLGILAYAEIASWQHIGGARFMSNAENMMRAMIRRDRNHPSIILWGLLNEGRSKPLFERLHTVAHECDPTRPTVYAENEPEEGLQLGTVHIPDVLGLNYKLPHLAELRAMLPDKKLFSSEHTNADFCRRGDRELEDRYLTRLEADLEILAAHPFMAGGTLWCMHDYATDYAPTWPHHFSGVMDHVRLYKEAAHLLRAWWRADLNVHIAGHWTFPGEEGREKTVRVLSNGEQTELCLNNTSLGIKSGNRMLEWNVPYQPGKLVAKAWLDGETVECALETAGPAAALVLTADPDRILADAQDATLITVCLVDAQGRWVPENRAVALGIEGPAALRTVGGLPIVLLSAGVGRFAVQSTGEYGTVTVQAATIGIPGSRVEIQVGPEL
ncbi:MAG TPA: glycoside hydrolase family 2 TIM barrel-domain containing protein [bacterium]|nr:glycoside hydrolase family 2 TIM barrel-domain containing protein [bacterium]HQP99072.1 glycoside hydrolase family 2 TIM barrel-domain containing protein [bacterium]